MGVRVDAIAMRTSPSKNSAHETEHDLRPDLVDNVLIIPLTDSLKAALDPLIGNQDRDRLAKAAANVIDAWAMAQLEQWEKGYCMPGELGGARVTVSATVNFDDTIFKMARSLRGFSLRVGFLRRRLPVTTSPR